MKKYTVRQTVNLNNKRVIATFQTPTMDEGHLTAFLGLLEGGYEVVEVNTGLSNMTASETPKTNTLPIKSINLRGEKEQTAYLSAFGGATIHLKNGVSEDDIKNVFLSKKIYANVPDASIVGVSIKTASVGL